MAGTTRLELATSAVTGSLSDAGLHRMSRLRVQKSATVGVIGQGRETFVHLLFNPSDYTALQNRTRLYTGLCKIGLHNVLMCLFNTAFDGDEATRGPSGDLRTHLEFSKRMEGGAEPEA